MSSLSHIDVSALLPCHTVASCALPDTTQWVGVIGSRQASLGLRVQAFHLGATLACQGRVVVSGLALGVDGSAHAGALSIPEGLTVAILSTAPTEPVYPRAHTYLAVRIPNRGALVHPFTGPAVTPLQRTRRFLERDILLGRLVAALVVVADTEPITGGSRWATAEALRRGIPVFRLDAAGRFHAQPRVLPAVCDWDPECSLLQTAEFTGDRS